MENFYASQKTIGALLLAGAVALLIPYTVLTATFHYPAILREDTASILTKFYEGGSPLIWTWFAFAVTGLPLLPAYVFIGQRLEGKAKLARFATVLGVTGLVVQMVGLLRWTFVVPVLANSFVHAADAATKAAAVVSFKTLHQFGGVILGEHLGQLFTIAWTVLITLSSSKLKLFPKWINAFGIIASFVYLLAQAELFATVVPGFPVWRMAGAVGSTLWLLWLIIIGIRFFTLQKQNALL